jgi:hypothetical protein
MKTQAWGWLAAAVLAAGLNASYHDGGLEWAHVAANRMEHSSAAVMALARGHVGQFLAEARLVSEPASDGVISDRTIPGEMIAERVQTSSCPWATAIARAQMRVSRAEARIARAQAISDRQQAELEQFEANRERLQARIEAETGRLRSITVNPAVMRSLELSNRCQRVHVSIPRVPEVHISVPEVHLDLPGDPL